jgi:hypothetical protein
MSTNKPIYKHEMVWGTVYDTWYEVCVVDVYGQPIKEYMDGVLIIFLLLPLLLKKISLMNVMRLVKIWQRNMASPLNILIADMKKIGRLIKVEADNDPMTVRNLAIKVESME